MVARLYAFSYFYIIRSDAKQTGRTGQQSLIEGFNSLQIDMSHQSSGLYIFISNVSDAGERIIINKLK